MGREEVEVLCEALRLVLLQHPKWEAARSLRARAEEAASFIERRKHEAVA